MPIKIDSPLARRVAAFAFLVFIFGLTFWVLSPFLASLAWAGILAYVTWPLHQWLCRRLPGRDRLAALLMTLGVAAALLLPMLWVMVTVVDDVAVASAAFKLATTVCRPCLPACAPGRAASGSPGNISVSRPTRAGCASKFPRWA